jgi:ABC-type histidine transport system ATPase subunit
MKKIIFPFINENLIMGILSVDNLVKNYGGIKALKGVSFFCASRYRIWYTGTQR